ncbi:MAG: lysophospholipid acyltransferase family protein [Verrucomicrobiota bacterium]|nr:lysophospholipid acyltransferase family protein [Verrucomicrobiota bacterium]
MALARMSKPNSIRISICYYLSLLFFALGVIVLNLGAVLFQLIPRTTRTRQYGQMLFRKWLQLYLATLRYMGVFSVRWVGLDTLMALPPCVIIANHPSMLDALILLAYLPKTVCFFKDRLAQRMLPAFSARILGFISNASGIDGIKMGSQAIREGYRILIFPEGTRTPVGGVDALKSAYAFIAMQTGAPVAILTIDVNSYAMGKTHNLWIPPPLPIDFTITFRLSMSLESDKNLRSLHETVEAYYANARRSPTSAHPIDTAQS